MPLHSSEHKSLLKTNKHGQKLEFVIVCVRDDQWSRLLARNFNNINKYWPRRARLAHYLHHRLYYHFDHYLADVYRLQLKTVCLSLSSIAIIDMFIINELSTGAKQIIIIIIIGAIHYLAPLVWPKIRQTARVGSFKKEPNSVAWSYGYWPLASYRKIMDEFW